MKKVTKTLLLVLFGLMLLTQWVWAELPPAPPFDSALTPEDEGTVKPIKKIKCVRTYTDYIYGGSWRIFWRA